MSKFKKWHDEPISGSSEGWIFILYLSLASGPLDWSREIGERYIIEASSVVQHDMA